MKATKAMAALTFLVLAGSIALAQEPHFPQEIPAAGRPDLSRHPGLGGQSWRGWIQSTVFPEFTFSGTLDEAIHHFMTESRKFSPTGQSVGSWAVSGIELDKVRVNMKLRGRNALEIIDALSALAQCNWTIEAHCIRLHRDAAP